MKRIFISGPMTGIDKYNFPKFDRIEKELIRKQWNVVNPANIARKYKVSEVISKQEVFDKMVNEELEALKTCDAILLLDGWNNSTGTRKELLTAIQYGLTIFLEKDHWII